MRYCPILLVAGVLLARVSLGGEAAAVPEFQPERLRLAAVLGDTRWRHAGSVTSVTELPDGRLLTTARDGTARLWDEFGKQARRFSHSKDDVWSALVLPGGKQFVTAGEDHQITLWDLESGVKLNSFAHQDVVFRMALVPGSNRIVACDRSKIANLWDVDTGALLKTFKGHTEAVYSAAATPDGKTLITGSSDHSVRIWNMDTAECRQTLTGHTKSVYTVALSPDGSRVASSSDDNSLKLWNLADGKEVWTATLGDGVTVISFSPDGQRIAASVDDRTIRVLQAADGKELLKMQTPSRAHWPAVFSRDGKRILTGGDSMTCFWDAATGKRLFPEESYRGHYSAVRQLAALPGGRLLSADRDGKVHLWDISRVDASKSGPGKLYGSGWSGPLRHLAEWQADDKQVNALAVSPDGARALAAGDGMKLRIWDIASGKLLKELDHGDDIYGASFAGGGRFAISGGDDNKTVIWNIEKGEKALTLEGHTNDVTCVDASGDGMLLATTSRDNNLLVWNVETGSQLASLECGEKTMNCCIFLGGRNLLAGSSDKCLRAWRPQPGLKNAAELAAAPGQLEKWIAQLSAEEFKDRQNAVVALSSVGERALPLLAKLDTSKNPDLLLLVRQVTARVAGANLPTVDAGAPLDLGGSVDALAAHPDGKHWAARVASERTSEVVIGSLTDKGLTVVRRLADDARGPRGLAFTPDGRCLLVGNGDSTISVYRME